MSERLHAPMSSPPSLGIRAHESHLLGLGSSSAPGRIFAACAGHGDGAAEAPARSIRGTPPSWGFYPGISVFIRDLFLDLLPFALR